MEREITQKLLLWKNSHRRKPLLLTGVRQCGKTYAIKDFGEKYYVNTVYLNFEANESLKGIFEFDYDVERILKEVRFAVKKQFDIQNTLLIFDEIQECPRAITSLKYFCENMPDLHLIGAGSLLGVALRNEKISFPVGKVNRMQMYPLNFKEFVNASGHGSLLSVLEQWPADRAFPPLYAVPFEKLLKEYYTVGGMPEAVNEWIHSNDIEEVEKIQDEILQDYADDFSKHAPLKDVEKIRWVWDSVPKQLAKENNKFVFSHVKEGKRAAELEDALQWLADAGLVYKLELVENAEIPLSSSADSTWFKLYMSDIGLLRRISGLSYMTIFTGNDLFIKYKGALAENYVMNELISSGNTPYFWRSGNTAEIDFLIEKENHIIPIEVKAADNIQAKSYKIFCKRYSPAKGIKASLKNIARNYCEQTETYNLPLWLLWNMDFYLQ